MGLFGKSPDPKEQVNDWCKKLRKESNQIERQINGIRREEAKVTKSLKDAAKKGDKDVCLVLAKEVVHARKTVNKLYCAKANINSVQMQMKGQLATIKVAGCLQNVPQSTYGFCHPFCHPKFFRSPSYDDNVRNLLQIL